MGGGVMDMDRTIKGRKASAPDTERAVDAAIHAGEMRLQLAHFGVFCVLYTLYAQHICPILNSRSFLAVIAPAVIALAALFGWSELFRRVMGLCHTPRCLRIRFRADFAGFLAAGVAVAVWNRYGFRIPLENALKVFTAFAALGFYITLDMALRRERNAAIAPDDRLEDAGFLPFTAKFLMFSVINLLVLAGVTTLVVWKDVMFLAARSTNIATFANAVLVEIVFVVTVFAAYVTRVVFAYGRNVRFALTTHTTTLRAIEGGDLNARMPVLTRDELGHMAQMTNSMVERLRSTLVAKEQAQEATIAALVGLAARRDNETGEHLRRTSVYVEMLARELRRAGHHGDALDDASIALIRRSAPLHDIGKVGVPDAILHKPGKLDDAEFEIMKTHTSIGAQTLAEAEMLTGGSDFLTIARQIAESHHEKWDGTGYPNGLAGEAIPLPARLMAVADVYDALRSPRIYKPAFDHAKAAGIIREGRGRHFDPAIVDAFEALDRQFARIASEQSDLVETEAPARAA